MGNRSLANRAIWLNCMDGAPVGKVRYRQMHQAFQRGLIIQRVRQHDASFREELPCFFRALAIVNVRASSEPLDDPSIAIA